MSTAGAEQLQVRVHGGRNLPVIIYLPGIHGDWTLIPSFRACVAGKVCFVEFTYPRTLEWTLDDYAEAIEKALDREGIRSGWLLGESFGSQVMWALCRRAIGRCAGQPADSLGAGFQPVGAILAGGFVRYPMPLLVRFASRFCGGVSLPALTRFLYVYARYARFRHRKAPETLASIQEFVARRTEQDRCAARHRLQLILGHDPRGVAKGLAIPLFSVTGGVDPIVPWWLVMPWLRRSCPAYRQGRVVWGADHNVLSTAPAESAALVLGWINPVPQPRLHPLRADG